MLKSTKRLNWKMRDYGFMGQMCMMTTISCIIYIGSCFLGVNDC